jgi:Ca2+-binding EF-hand superfamily protein
MASIEKTEATAAAQKRQCSSQSLGSPKKGTSSAQLSSRRKIAAEAILNQMENSQNSGSFRSSTSLDEKRRKFSKRADSARLRSVEYGVVGKVVVSSQFEVAVTVAVLLNALLIGVQVQHTAVSDKSTQAFELAEYMCTLVFTVELCARLSVHRSDFFTNPLERWWNIFDFTLVGVSLIDTSLSLAFGGHGGIAEAGAFVSKLGRTVRMFRIMRIIRTVRHLGKLRVIVHMIACSLQSLFWSWVIMLGLIYIVSVVLTQGATDYLKGPDAPTETSEYEQVLHLYGSLFDTMYTLFQCMSGGISWGLASQPMRGPGWLLEAIVIGFVFFMVFAVTNIVNGVFVDGAIELGRRDRTTMMEKQREEDADKETHLITLLTMMDADGDQMITFDEFSESLERQDVCDYISALEVEISDAKLFFQMLDKDGSGTVDIMEFMNGMRKLRGDAKSVDVHMMVHESKQLCSLVKSLVSALWTEWGDDEYPEERLND